MKSLAKLNPILKLLFALSPIIITSFFVWNPTFPAWAYTLLLGSVIALLISLSYAYKAFLDKAFFKVSTVALFFIGFVVAILHSFLNMSDRGFMFSLFGKGITEWTGLTIMSIFMVMALAHELTGKYRRIGILSVSITIALTIINFFIIQYLPKIGVITGYLNIPMISFGKLLSYPFIYSLAFGAGVLISFVLDKKGIILLDIKRFARFIFAVTAILCLFWVGNWSLRVLAAKQFVNASTAASQGDLIGAKNALDNAIKISPFDVYYLGRSDLSNVDLQNLLQSSSTNTEELQKKYSAIVQSQIDDANKAVAYDSKNPQNWLALGRAYEQSMLLTKDTGYQKALEAYETARRLVTDKDSVDTIKARLAFSADKESEGLGYLDNAIKLNPSSTPALYIYSQYYSLKNNINSAVEYAEKAVLTSPKDQNLRTQLGMLYAQQDRYKDAGIQFLAGIQINPNNGVLYYYLALSLKQIGDIENAKKVVAELESKFGTSPEVVKLKESLNSPTQTKNTEVKKVEESSKAKK